MRGRYRPTAGKMRSVHRACSLLLEMRKGQLLDNTIRTFAEQFGVEVSQEDARSSVANITGFFDVLSEWEAKETLAACPVAPADTISSAGSVSEELEPSNPNLPVYTSPEEEGES